MIAGVALNDRFQNVACVAPEAVSLLPAAMPYLLMNLAVLWLPPSVPRSIIPVV